MSHTDYEKNSHQSPFIENQGINEPNIKDISKQQTSPPFSLITGKAIQTKEIPSPFEKEKDAHDGNNKIGKLYDHDSPNDTPGIRQLSQSAAPPFQLKNSLIQRNPEVPAPATEEKDKVTGKLFIQQEIGKKEYSYAKAKSHIKLETEYSLYVPKSKGVGNHNISIGKKDFNTSVAVKKELEQKAKEKFMGLDWTLKENTELNNKGGKIGVEAGFEGERLFGSFKFIPVSVGQNDKKKFEIKFLNLAVELGIKGFEMKNMPVSFIEGATLDCKFKGSLICEIEPDMNKIALELTRRAGLIMGEGLALDLGAVGASAATVALPALASGLMIAGALQTEKNIAASHAASYAGGVFRQKARTYARDYANAMTGGSIKGEGGAAAETMLALWSATNGVDQDEAIEEFTKANGSFGKVYETILKSAKDHYFPKAVEKFKLAYANEFGILESIGDTWGMIGQFQRHLRAMLYVDDFR